MKAWLVVAVYVVCIILAFMAGHDQALTSLANDMHAGQTSLRDNRLVLEIKGRRFWK